MADRPGIALTLCDLADIARGDGSLVAAERSYHEALRAATAVEHRLSQAHALSGLATVAVSRGEVETTARLFSAARAVSPDAPHAAALDTAWACTTSMAFARAWAAGQTDLPSVLASVIEQPAARHADQGARRIDPPPPLG